MRFNKRFPNAVHIVLIVAEYSKEQKVTSEFIAEKISCNPVIVRTLIGGLKQAEILTVDAKKGTLLARPLDDINLFEVLQAAEPNAMAELRGACKSVAKRCPTGQLLNDIIASQALRAFEAAKEALSTVTLAETLNRLLEKEEECPLEDPRALLDGDYADRLLQDVVKHR